MNAETTDAERGEPFRLLFVCTGNTCRSPMAEALARRGVASRGWTHVEVRSAGISTGGGAPPSTGAVRAAQRHGLDLSGHRSQPLTPELVASVDVILTMTAGHLALLSVAGAGDKAHLLGDFASGEEAPEGRGDVPDPFGGPDAEYEETFNLLEELVEAALSRLTPQVQP